MKRNKMIALLSIACSATTLFAVGCTQNAAQARPKTPVNTEAAGTLVDGAFITAIYEEDWEYYASTATTLSQSYGEYEDHTKSLILFSSMDKDFMNNVVETYTVYNVNTGKVVYTYVNKYEDIDYDAYDKFGNEIYAEREFDIELMEEDNGLEYIQLYLMEYARYDDEIIEKEGLETSYYPKSISYVAYDVNGKLIVEEKDNTVMFSSEEFFNEIGYVGDVFGGYKYLVGDTVVITDINGNITDTFKASKQKAPSLYNYKNDKYGYYYQKDPRLEYIEVYELSTGKLVYRYTADAMEKATCFVLQNGNIYIQTMAFTMDPNADIYDAGEGYGYNVVGLYVNVSAGTVKTMKSEYLFQEIYNRDYTEAMIEMANVPFVLGDKLQNFGAAIKISDYLAMMESENSEAYVQMVAVDNNMNVVHIFSTFETSVPGVGKLPFVSATMLATGDYLVDIETPLVDPNSGDVIDQAIVKADGTLRTYLPDDAEIVDDYILIEDKGLYDFDMNLIYDFAERLPSTTYDGNEIKYEFVKVIGDNILMKMTRYNKHNIEVEPGTWEYVSYYYDNYIVLGKAMDGEFHYEEFGESFGTQTSTINFRNGYFYIEDQDDSADYYGQTTYGKNRVVVYNLEGQRLVEINLDRYYYWDVWTTDNSLCVIMEGSNGNKILQFKKEAIRDNYVGGWSDRNEWLIRDDNNNGIPDGWDELFRKRFGDHFEDSNKNGIPDEMEYWFRDEYGSGFADSNNNGIPDETEGNIDRWW